MRQLFKNILITVPELKLDELKKETKLLLTDIGGVWYINNLIEKQPQLKNQY